MKKGCSFLLKVAGFLFFGLLALTVIGLLIGSGEVSEPDETTTVTDPVATKEPPKVAPAPSPPPSQPKSPAEVVPTIFDPRERTSSDGERTFVGTLLELGNKTIKVEREGKPLTFDVDLLSKADQEFLGQNINLVDKSGKDYGTGSVVGISPEELTFATSSGLTRIPLRMLPDKMGRQFGYDPEAVAQRKREEARRKIAERKAEEARDKRLEVGFSSWDGSHRGLTKVIKDSMKIPRAMSMYKPSSGTWKITWLSSQSFEGKTHLVPSLRTG